MSEQTQTLTQENAAREAVERGVAFLDSDRPDWWKADAFADLTDLNVTSETTCVAARVYGTFSNRPAALRGYSNDEVGEDRASRHGMCSRHVHVPPATCIVTEDTETEAVWREIIAARRTEANLPVTT